MDLFLMIRRKKLTLFIEAKESMTVFELKRMIEGITRKVPNEQRLFTSENVVSLEQILWRNSCTRRPGKTFKAFPSRTSIAVAEASHFIIWPDE
jgi:hypothetical protein